MKFYSNRYMTFYLHRHTFLEIEESFRFFDKDGSGSIDTTELAAAMKTLGICPNETELTRMIEEVDIDGELPVIKIQDGTGRGR